MHGQKNIKLKNVLCCLTFLSYHLENVKISFVVIKSQPLIY